MDYRVRKFIPPGDVYRAVEKLATFASEAEATAALRGNPERQRDIPDVYRQRRDDSYPTREECPLGSRDQVPLRALASPTFAFLIDKSAS